MTSPEFLAAPVEDVALATVHPLVAPSDTRDELGRALRLLERLAGSHGAGLPVALGRPAVRAETILGQAPTALDPAAAPAAAIATAERVLRSATAIVDLMVEEAHVLGEALSADLGTLRLDELLELAEAVLAASVAPRAAPGWGARRAAEDAETVLRAASDDLRRSARSHVRIYDRFTEDVWEIPSELVRSGRHRWRFIARARLHRELRDASRTGRRQRRLNTVAADVLDAMAARERVVSLAPLLRAHLGHLDHGALTDVDAVLAAVGAVRRVQAALGSLLDADRLQQLLRAGAFESRDVVDPALNLRTAMRAWAGDVIAAGGTDPLGLTLPELARWAAECAESLPALVEGHAALERFDAPAAATVRSLVDTLLLRQRVHELLEGEPCADRTGLAGSVS